MLIVLALVLGAPAGAAGAPAITVTDFTLAPAAPDAGASVDASSSTSLSYANSTEDVKKTIGHFAPGLLANPETVPHCPQALYLADACPADTLIGSSSGEIDTIPNTGITTTVSGRIYNQELLEGEAGRLGIILDTPVTKTFLTAPFYVRSNGDYGLDGVLDDLPRALTQLGVGNTQIKRLSFTLFGVVNGRKFTRGPTNCSLHVSTGEAFGYDDPTAVKDGPVSSYTPTNCDKLPFKPTFSIAVGSKGATGERDHPSLAVHVTQGAGEAGISANGVTLPFELGPNLAAFDVLCTSAQLAVDACPAGSRVGTTTATSNFVATPLSGPVYLVQQPGVILPALVADLRGRVHVQLTIANTILGGRLIKSTVTGVPDLPVSTFDLALDAGPGSPLENKFDLCRKGSKPRAMSANVTFTGQNGATVASKPAVHVPGCGPVPAVSLRKAASRRPSLRVKLRRHPDGGKLARFTLTLPRQLAPEPRAGQAPGAGDRLEEARAQRREREGPPHRHGQRVAEGRSLHRLAPARQGCGQAHGEGPPASQARSAEAHATRSPRSRSTATGSAPVRRRAPGASGPSLDAYLQAAADGLHDHLLGLLERLRGGRDRLEDPCREHLLDRTVEAKRGELGREVAAERAGVLSLADDLRDALVSPADLVQVCAPEGVGRPCDLDDDHLHQVGIVAVGIDDERRNRLELVADRQVTCVHGGDLLQQQGPTLGEEGVEDLVLRAEVVVHEAVRDARLVRDRGHAATVKALPGEHPDGGVEDHAALVDRVLVARGHRLAAWRSR